MTTTLNPNDHIRATSVDGTFRTDTDGAMVNAKVSFVEKHHLTEIGDNDPVQNGHAVVDAGNILARYVHPTEKDARGLPKVRMALATALTTDALHVKLKDDVLGYDFTVPVGGKNITAALKTLDRLYGLAASTLRSRRENPHLEDELMLLAAADVALKEAGETEATGPALPLSAEQMALREMNANIRALTRVLGAGDFDLAAEDRPKVNRPAGMRLSDSDLALLKKVTFNLETALDSVLAELGDIAKGIPLADPREITQILTHKARLYREGRPDISAQERRMALRAMVLRDQIAQLQSDHPDAAVNLSVRENVVAADEQTADQVADARELAEAGRKATADTIAKLRLRNQPSASHHAARSGDMATYQAVFALVTTEKVAGGGNFHRFEYDNSENRRIKIALQGREMRTEWAAKAKSNITRLLGDAMGGYTYRTEFYKYGDSVVMSVIDHGGAYAYVFPQATLADPAYNADAKVTIGEDDLVTEEELTRLEVITGDLLQDRAYTMDDLTEDGPVMFD